MGVEGVEARTEGAAGEVKTGADDEDTVGLGGWRSRSHSSPLSLSLI
jgi:hypothetical protein